MNWRYFVSVVAVLALICIPDSKSVPFIVLHGIADACANKKVQSFTQHLKDFSKIEGFCVEVGNGIWDSWFMTLEKQAAIVCDKVKQMKELQLGYNIVGLSQGNLIGRGVVEYCEGGPPVKNFISLAGPHAGTASVPLCGSGPLCAIANELIKSAVYSDFVQAHLTPSGYLKLPNDIPNYLKKCSYLPKLNNELPDKRNATYKGRFTSLQNLILIMDNVLIPRETSWFGYYPDGAFKPVIFANKTKLYSEDWIGLKALDDAGKVKFISIPGNHIEISISDMQKHVIPYLVDQPSKLVKPDRSNLMPEQKQQVHESESDDAVLDGVSSFDRPTQVKTFFSEMLGFS